MFGWLFRDARLNRLMKSHWQLRREVDALKRKVGILMATQAELAQQLTDLGTQVQKIGTETQGLIAKIAVLEAAILANPVTAELQAAFDAVKLQVQAVDDAVPDA